MHLSAEEERYEEAPSCAFTPNMFSIFRVIGSRI
jgi:hypothetical protein